MTRGWERDERPRSLSDLTREAYDGPWTRLAALAARACGFSDATVCLVRPDGLHIVAATRMDAGTSEDVLHGYDEAVVRGRRPVRVEDVAAEAPILLGAASPGPGPRRPRRGAYAGVPVVGPDGEVAGVVSVSEPTARPVPASTVGMLEDFALILADLFDLVLDDPAYGGSSADAVPPEEPSGA